MRRAYAEKQKIVFYTLIQHSVRSGITDTKGGEVEASKMTESHVYLYTNIS